VIVDAREVSLRYRNGRGVGPLTLRLENAACVAIMGPNGAGKSTLLRLLATADRPRAGRIMWNGSSSLTEARRELGYAPDIAVEEGSLTARQATHFWCSQWSQDDVAQCVSAALDTFELLAYADEPVSSLSFGMRRRLCLAQALAHQPRLALLDEPTAGLDPAGVDALRQLMWSRRENACTVVASNDPEFVASSCDRVLFLLDGRVVRDASPDDLLAEVGESRRAELEVVGHLDLTSLRRIRGVGDVQRDDGVVSVELLDDAALGRVVMTADDGNGRLRSVRIHSPDLNDSFRHLTGRACERTGARI
jgi:ABC-2 type transport system ATP-binding protein